MKLYASALVASVLFVQQASSITIVLDYSHDTSTDNFFNTHPAAKAALEKARDDIQAAISSTPAAITNDITSATFNTTTANYNFSFTYTNPSTGAAQTITTSTMNGGEVRFFIGMRELSSSTLAQGGVGGYGISVNGSGVPADWPSAVAAANAAATAERLRGTGPTISTLTGTVTLGGINGNVQVSTGSAVGTVWFDSDSNNDGLADADPLLDTYWHYDHTTPVAAGKNDFYSVSLHEILHSLGFGASESWENNRSGTNWTGSNVIALQGTGTGVVDPGGAHIAAGLTSPRLSDSVVQEAAMAPTITTGTRKELTQLDLAFLRDINWSTIPEPSSATITLALLGGALLRRRRQ